MPTYTKAEVRNMKANQDLSERWVQDIVAADPTVLGLGDCVLRSYERSHSGAGRLDLLLQDQVSDRRYVVELQLGPTDERHIIRTLEYWDIERKRYPQYEHCAVLIAEEVTARFSNVLSLFNEAVPFIAIQMKALKVGDHYTLVFTKVLDEVLRGTEEEDEGAAAVTVNREYWMSKAGVEAIELVDRVFELIQPSNPNLSLAYKQQYIGAARGGAAFNFVIFKPATARVNVEIKLPQTDDITAEITNTGLDMDYSNANGRYRLRLRPGAGGCYRHPEALTVIAR
jgi:hypothetical protein